MWGSVAAQIPTRKEIATKARITRSNQTAAAFSIARFLRALALRGAGFYRRLNYVRVISVNI
jgi:hypothetical protein